MAEIMADALKSVMLLLVGGAVTYFWRSVSGERRASVRATNAEAMGKEVEAESKAFELAQRAISELELERKARRILEERVSVLEDEKANWQKERDEMLKELTLLRDQIGKGRGGFALKS